MNWVLLRGLGREARHWGNLTKKLSGENSNIILTLDLPGAGKLSNINSPLNIAEYSEHLSNQFYKIKQNSNHKKINEPFGIIAISLGGMIALDWLNRYPNDFTSGVLINTSISGLSSPLERMKLSGLKEIIKILKIKDHVKRERLILDLTTSMLSSDDKKIWSLIFSDIFTETKMSKLNVLKQLAAAARFKKPEFIKTPMLILCSKKDSLVNYNCSLSIAKYYKSDLEIHLKAGHDLPIDDPDWVLNKIEKFMNKL